MPSFTDLGSYFQLRFADVIRDRADMHGYQDDIGVPFMKKNPFSALFVDLGLGKSVMALTVIADMLAEGEWGPWLVIGPKRVVSSTWPTEIREWRHLAHLTTAAPFDKQYRKELAKVARETSAFCRDVADLKEPTFDLPADHNRMIGFYELRDKWIRKRVERDRMRQARISIVGAFERNPAIIHLINREQFEHLVAAWGPERFPYRLVFIDESQSFKSHKSGRVKAMKAVRIDNDVIQRMHHLTATPAAESYEDLFTPTLLLDKGKRLGRFITNYRKRYFDKGYDGWTWKLKKGAEEAIAERLSDLCLTMKAADYYPMEKPLYIKRPVVLSREERKRYDDFAEDFVLTLPSGEEITAENAAVLQQKLLQCASGAVYDDKKRVHHLHDAKLETLAEVIEEAGDTPVLVAYWFKPTLARLKKAFPKGVELDAQSKIVPKWNKRQVPIMFIHPASGGAGLNLQHGSHILVMVDMFYSNEFYTQLVGRLARQGQKEIVRIIHLVAQGTLDDTVLDAIDDKEHGQERLFAALKAIRNRMLAKRDQL
jgi:hypothetical protein